MFQRLQANHLYFSQVTFVSPFSPKKEIPNVREIALPDMDFGPMTPNAFDVGPDEAMQALWDVTPGKCIEAMQMPEIKELYNEKFDLIFIKASFCECFFAMAHHFQVFSMK